MILSICLNCSLEARPDFSARATHAPPDVTRGGKGLNLARWQQCWESR